MVMVMVIVIYIYIYVEFWYIARRPPGRQPAPAVEGRAKRRPGVRLMVMINDNNNDNVSIH